MIIKQLAKFFLFFWILFLPTSVLAQTRMAENSTITCTAENLCSFSMENPAQYADFVVPAGVNALAIELTGGSGGVSDVGQEIGQVGYLAGTVAVTPGNTVRLGVGGGGQSAALGGLGGTNSVGGFAGGAGGLGISGSASGGGGGAATVIFYLDQVFIAGGGGGANGAEAGGGGGGGEQGGIGGLVSPATNEFATSGGTRGLNLSSTTIQIAPSTNGSIKVSYTIIPVKASGKFNPQDPLSNPTAVANFAVTAIAALGSVASLWLSPQSNTEDIGSISNVDLADSNSISRTKSGWGDRLKIWRSSYLISQDRDVAKKIWRWASVSNLMTRLNIDGAYLRAMIGAPVAQLKTISFLLGIVVGFSTDSLFALNSKYLILILAIGVLDALAGAFGFLGLILILLFQFGSFDPATIQYLSGLVLLGFAPILAGMAFRDFRRDASSDFTHIWNRIADLFLATFFIVWINRNLLDGLPVLARQEVDFAQNTSTVGLVVGGTFLLRLSLEEFAARFFPERLRADHAEDLPEQSFVFKFLAIAFRTFIFAVVSFSFIGLCWQLWVGTALFVIPQVLNLINFEFKISPKLKSLLPIGLPGFVFSLILGLVAAKGLSLLLGETREFAKNVFALAPIPMTILNILKTCGVSETKHHHIIESVKQNKLLSLLIGGSLFVLALILTKFI
jgi:hypothetical protein